MTRISVSICSILSWSLRGHRETILDSNCLWHKQYACADPEGGHGGPQSPGKLQKYRVP